MEIFRISHENYSQNLTASGEANRWNQKGQFVIYAGSSRSLSALELIVHRGAIKILEYYKMLVISASDDDSLVKQILINNLPDNWRSLSAYSTLQNIGGIWYSNNETLILKVPSVVIPHEYNYVINLHHPEFSNQIQLVRTEDFFWDDRLL